MSEHILKIHTAPLDDLLSGLKTGEVRRCDDRIFEVFDTVKLVEVDGDRTAEYVITHIQTGYGLPDGMCVLSYASAARTAQAEPVAYRGMPNDFITHQDTWRQALERLIELEPESVEGQVDDKAFWRHELAAFDRAYAELEVARTAPAEPAMSLDKYMDMMYDRDSHAKEVERLKNDCASLRADRDAFGQNAIDLKAENKRLREEVERLNNALEVEKRSLQCEVNRRNQYAQESDELDRQVQALKADAERFKYVLSQIPANLGEVFCQCLTATDDDIIEAIDAARTAKPEVDHE